MPAVLIEIGFIDNSMDNDLFDSKRREIINQIAKVINNIGKVKRCRYQSIVEYAYETNTG